MILALISMAAVTPFFARPYQQFITVFARDVVHGDVGTAGLMQAAPGPGHRDLHAGHRLGDQHPVEGEAAPGRRHPLPRSLIAFSWSSNLYLSLALLVLVGGLNMTWQTTLNTLLQTNVGDEMRAGSCRRTP